MHPISCRFRRLKILTTHLENIAAKTEHFLTLDLAYSFPIARSIYQETSNWCQSETKRFSPGCVDCIPHSSVRVRGWIRMFTGYEPNQSYHISLWVLGLCAWIKVLHSILKIGQKTWYLHHLHPKFFAFHLPSGNLLEFAIENGLVEIVQLPTEHGGSFPSVFC